MRGGGGTVVRRGGKPGVQEREKAMLNEVDPARCVMVCTLLMESSPHAYKYMYLHAAIGTF